MKTQEGEDWDPVPDWDMLLGSGQTAESTPRAPDPSWEDLQAGVARVGRDVRQKLPEEDLLWPKQN